MIEFMAAGLPIVFTDCQSHREIVGDDKVGIAVDSLRPESIADAIEYLVRNPVIANQLGQEGLRVVRQRLNWESEAKKLIGFYENILHNYNS